MSENDLTAIKVDVAQLQVQVTTLASLCTKMDTVIEKLVAQQDKYIEQIYRDMDNKRIEKNGEIREIHSRIDTVIDKIQITELALLKEISEIRKQITEQANKEQTAIDKLNHWKWTITGGIIVISWLMSHGMELIARLFLTK